MKKFSVFLLIVLFCGVTAFAQIGRCSVSGRVVGKNSHSPIEYATVMLRDGSTHKVITGVVTDSLGRFDISGIKYGSYDIRCSFIGFADYLSPLIMLDGNDRTKYLGTIFLNDSGEILDNATVSAHRSTYVQSIDKKIFNVGSDIAGTSGSASDLLQNVPSLQVDIDGNVSLRGNENVQILIDGKPSVMMRGGNRGMVLQQIQASSIERIEVITNPSAQFKPDGTSGIINLIMKKDNSRGIDGSVLANAGNEGRYNGTFSLGWKTAKFGINGSYGYRADRRDRWTTNDRTLKDASAGTVTDVSQNTVSKAPSQSHIAGLDLQWQPSAKDVFEVGGNYTHMTFPRTEDNRMVQQEGTEVEKDYVRHRFDNEMQQDEEGSASYSHTFDKGKTLVLDYVNAIEDEIEKNRYSNHYVVPADSSTADNTLIKQRNYENLVRLTYSDKINDRDKIVAGYEAELDKSDMRYLAEDLSGTEWVKNTVKSNNFIFNEQVHSIYATWEHKSGGFSFLTGIRGEQSYIKSRLLTLDETVRNNYFMAYPTLHTSYEVGEFNDLQLNYSLRVNRPEGDDLNPFPEYQDPYNIKAGNPYLKPEKIHSFEFGWQYKRGVTTVILTPYYRYAFDKMTEITRVLDGGIIETTKENLSSGSEAGAEFIFNSAFGSWCDFNINSNMFYNTIDAQDLGYSAHKGAFAWYIAANADFTIAKNLMLQLNSRYKSSELTPQGRKLGTGLVNMGARYDFRKRNLSFTATCSDVFDSYKSVLIVDTPAIHQRVEKRRSPRTFYVGVCYRFGYDGNKKHDDEIRYEETM